MGSLMLEARALARRTRNRWVDHALARVEAARRALLAGEADILLLGDSSCLSWAYTDTDRTLLPQMLAERTGQRVVTVAAGGFSPPVYDAILRVLAQLPTRPKAVVTTGCIRTSTFGHVRLHPEYGYARSIEALDRITGGQRVCSMGRRGVPTDDELTAFRARTMTTVWGGEKTIGEHLAMIEGRGPAPWPVEVERARFDYFNGTVLTPDNAELSRVASFGARLAAYGVPTAAYWVMPPVGHGEELLPGFRDHVLRNLAVFEGALDLPGQGLPALIKLDLEDADFQDRRSGVEHYSFSGRTKIADALVTSLATQVG